MRRAPEERRGERGEDHQGAQVRPADERREAGVGDAVGRLQARAAGERGGDVRAVDRARVEVVTEVVSSGLWRRSFGYARSSSLVLGVSAPTTISFQPIRSA